MTPGKLVKLRSDLHKKICTNILRKVRGGGYNNADNNSKASRDLSIKIAEAIPHRKEGPLPVGQESGTLFGQFVMEFVKASSDAISHLRPGDWTQSTSTSDLGIAMFDQYEHLATLKQLQDEYRELAAALGTDYLVKPDIVILRKPEPDERINARDNFIGPRDAIARHTPLRKKNHEGAILHASISCKWTIRSDRAQNTRTEALNIQRNRKGRGPAIVAVTFEPLPSRIASIAMGTGDIDCTYHGALYELEEAVNAIGSEEQRKVFRTLLEGRRLRDISDLPLDLTI